MITLVCSFPRAGSSLMMRMLCRGGMPMCGNSLSGETDLTMGLPKDWYWMKGQDGKCIKILDPQRWTPPARFEYRIIWMTRDHHQQTLSQLKLLKMMFMGIDSNEKTIRNIEQSMDKDELPVLKMLGTLGQCMTVWFEELLQSPMLVAGQVNQFVGGQLDVHAMASEVRKRPTDCLPYMLELDQLEGKL